MMRYVITVTQLVPDEKLTKPDDRIANPAGRYPMDADNKVRALEIFHETVPIGCLDDFRVEIEQEPQPGEKHYVVTIRETRSFEIVVFAADKDEARERAVDEYTADEDMEPDHTDVDHEDIDVDLCPQPVTP